MWLFTRYGLFSVSAKANHVEVRARSKSHLEKLLKRFAGLQQYKILALPNRDYAFRTQLTKLVWASIVSDLVIEQTWSNFKDECKQSMKDDPVYIELLHDVWWAAKVAYNKKPKSKAKIEIEYTTPSGKHKALVDVAAAKQIPFEQFLNSEEEVEYIDGNPKNQELSNLRIIRKFR